MTIIKKELIFPHFQETIDLLNPLKVIIQSYGGELYFVGGSVRNVLINEFHDKNIPIKDFDIMIGGLNDDVMNKIIHNHPNFKTEQQGNSFGVYIYYANGEQFELALARKDKQVGNGHSDIIVDTNNISLLEDALRRESRINSLYMDFDCNIIDPLNGIEDLKNKIITHNSDAFSDDPLRALRACRQAGQFEFMISETTLTEISKVKKNIHTIDPMRIYEEMNKILSTHNLIGLAYLKSTGLLNELFGIDADFFIDFDAHLSVEQKLYHLTSNFDFTDLSVFFKKVQAPKRWIQFIDIMRKHINVFKNFSNSETKEIESALQMIKRSPFTFSDFAFLMKDAKNFLLLSEDYFALKANTSLDKEKLIQDLAERRSVLVQTLKKQ